MRKTTKAFTRNERKAALWALTMAAAITAGGLLIEQTWRRPSLGPDGAASYAFAPLPGVLDAQPAG